ncbi:MAG TPA: hypothetical protein VHW74_13000 [Mycobacteriales bacterium]|nr:hypothetical protein [Mycobacteriales bacterium]
MEAVPGLWPVDEPCSDADYDDQFVAPASKATDRSAEQWMRDSLEGAPVALRKFVTIGWRLVLGFRPHRDNAIFGWPIVAKTHEYVVLEQQSRLFHAALLLRTHDGEVTWATRVVYKTKTSKAVWAVVGILHRRISPYVLGRAARRSAR